MDDRQRMADMMAHLELAGLQFKAYPSTYMLNVTDADGVVQSYYVTTGTAIFRDGNDRFKQHRHTEHDMPFERFLALCKGDEDILETFFE